MRQRAINLSVGAVAGLLILASLFPSRSRAQLIPYDRSVNWTNMAGVVGGIPTNRVEYTNVVSAGADPTGVLDSYLVVSNAVANCPTNNYVYFPTGTYKLTNFLTGIQGTSWKGTGPNSLLLFTLPTNSTHSCIEIFGTGSFISPGANTNLIFSGYTKGSSNVSLVTTTGVSVGKIVLIDQSNDTNFVFNQDCDYCSRDTGGWLFSQMAEITAVSGTNVTFWPPLVFTYTNTFTPTMVTGVTFKEGFGIEDMTITNAATIVGGTALPDQHTIEFQYVKGCWLKGVQIQKPVKYFLNLLHGFQCEVRRCVFTDGWNFIPNHNYGVALGLHCTSVLIEDNIGFNLRSFIEGEALSAYNTIGYNFATNMVNLDGSGDMIQDYGPNHGAHPHFNLIEGNIGNAYFVDFFHGSSSHNTAYRNRLWGYSTNYTRDMAVAVFKYNLYENFVGNVLGDTNFTSSWLYERVLTNTGVTPVIYRLGYASGSTSTNGWDQRVVDTIERHMNYDTSTLSVVVDGTQATTNITAAPSFYKTGTPSWWPAGFSYPGIGADIPASINNPINAALVRYYGLTGTNNLSGGHPAAALLQ